VSDDFDWLRKASRSAEARPSPKQLDPLLDDLCREFEISDRDTLRDVILAAGGVFIKHTTEREWRDGLPDTLGELPDAIDKVIDLLVVPVNTARLMRALFDLPPDQARNAPRCIADLRLELETMKGLVPKASSARSNPTGPVRETDLRATVQVLVRYWTGVLGNEFRHANWATGKHGRLEPTRPGERFVYEVLREISPDRANELSTIAREFTDLRGLRPRRPKLRK
jgi:hypothetical protein